jgi:hypothetical protein
MPRKKKASAAYSLKVVATVNGRISKADLRAFDSEGKLQHTDRAQLTEAVERRKVAERLARKFKLKSVEKVEADLELAWNAALQEELRKQEEEQSANEAPESGSRPGASYFVENGRIYRRRYDREGNEVSPEALCNFASTIETETTYDDGSGEIHHCFRVVGRLWNGEPLTAVDVPAGEFATMNWPIKHWGVRAIVSPGQGAKDHLRCAIQELSPHATRQTVYRQTGWRQIDGQWYFLHAGGAIGTDGTVGRYTIDLPGNLALFSLPKPPEGKDLSRAVCASLRILELARERITSPLLGAVYRSTLGNIDFSLHLVGPSGSFKTEGASLAQRHFGPALDSRHLPGSWSSTANANESLLFTAADCLVVIDDFAPGGSQSDVARFHRDADRVIRSVGNRSARMRLRADGELRPPRPPRCLPLSTGEEIPKGHSVRGRLGIVEVSKNEIDVDKLTACQNEAREGNYAAAMSAYVRWQAQHYDQLREEIPCLLDELRQEYRDEESHARTPGILADLALGWRCFLRFAVETGAIDSDEARDYSERARAGLLTMGRKQAIHQEASEPAKHFMRLIRTVLASGRAHIASILGIAPQENAGAWGWRGNTVSVGNTVSGELQPQGKCIGWIEGDAVYLDPDGAHAEAQKLAHEQNDSLSVSCQTLGKRLHEKKYLTCMDQERERLTVRKTCQGARRQVWQLHVNSFLGSL